jgi:hypothetical protein
MSTQLNLKEIERKAFRSTYEDGLWDIYFGLIVICMSIFIYRPASGYSPTNIILALLAMSVAYSLFWAAKKYITAPRMGQVRFGDIRRKKKTTMAMFLSFVVLAQLIILGLTTLGWLNPDVGAGVNHFLKSQDLMDLTVALIGSLFVVVGMTLTAYFSDFPRGYFIAAMMALAVFLMIYLNQPVYPILIGALMIIPGAMLFFRFLKKYPLPGEAGQDE